MQGEPFRKTLKKALANVDAMEKATENLEEGEKDNATYRQYLFKAIKDWQTKKAEIKKILDDKRTQDKKLQPFAIKARDKMKKINESLKAGKDVAREGKEFAKKNSVVTRKTLTNAVSGKNGTTGVLGSLKTAKDILDNYDKNPKKVKESEIKKGIDLLEKAGEPKGYIKSITKLYAGANMRLDMFDAHMPKITGFNKIKQEAKKVCDKLVNLVKGKKWKNVAAVKAFAKNFANSQQALLDTLCGNCIEYIEYLEEEERNLAKDMVGKLFNLYVFNSYEPPKKPEPKRLPSAGGGYYLNYDVMFSGGGDSRRRFGLWVADVLLWIATIICCCTIIGILFIPLSIYEHEQLMWDIHSDELDEEYDNRPDNMKTRGYY